MYRRAFTLIELLVVMAIIALIAGLMFPVFAQTKKRSYDPGCISQMRQLYMAVQLYMQDNSGQNPRILPNVASYTGSKDVYHCPIDPIREPLQDGSGYLAAPFVNEPERSSYRVSYGFLGSVPGFDTPERWSELVNHSEIGMLADPWHGGLKDQHASHADFLREGPTQQGPNLRINMDGSFFRLAKTCSPDYMGDTWDLYFYREGCKFTDSYFGKS